MIKHQEQNAFIITTDDTLRETIPHGTDRFPFAYYPEDIWLFDFHRIDWHWHHELELLTVAEGTARCFIGNDQLTLHAGCGIFINSGILHRFEADSSTFTPNIVFSPALLAPEKSLLYEKYIQPVLTSCAPYQVFDPKHKWQKQVLELLDQIYALWESEEKNELRTVQLLFHAWDLLFTHAARIPASYGTRRLNHRQARLQVMMQYIHDHYPETVTLEEIAAAALVSKSSALHLFQSGIQISPVAYLIQYRLSRAAGMLCTTKKPVSAIAEETGFASAGYFCRKFRQHYQMSPMEYRRRDG